MSEKATPKVARDAAEADFARWVETMGLEDKLDESDLEREDRKAYLALKNCLIKAIVRGTLVVNDDGLFVFTPRFSEDKKPLTFHRPNGGNYKDMQAANKAKFGSGQARFLAAITRETDVRFEKMDLVYDMEVCSAISALFLG